MRLLFVCGSLAQGKDGVGDYTVRIASEIIRHGHDANVLGIADLEVSPQEEAREEVRRDAGIFVRCLRLAVSMDLADRLSKSRDWISSFSPDWVSFQCVAHAYHRRGVLPMTMIREPWIQGGWRVHVCMHELWQGEWRSSTLKDRILGYLQRDRLRRFLRKHTPSLITTNNHLYSALLRRDGFKAEVIENFSNIGADAPDHVPEERTQCIQRRDGELVVGIFSSPKKGLLREEVLPYLERLATALKKPKMRLVHFGVMNAPGVKIWEICAANWQSRGHECVRLGFLTPEELASTMRQLALGLVFVPPELAGKSGVVAAYRVYGVPQMFLTPSVVPVRNLGNTFLSGSMLRLETPLDIAAEHVRTRYTAKGTSLGDHAAQLIRLLQLERAENFL